MNTRSLTALFTIVLTFAMPITIRTQEQVPGVVIKYEHNLMPVPSFVQFYDGKVQVTE